MRTGKICDDLFGGVLWQLKFFSDPVFYISRWSRRALAPLTMTIPQLFRPGGGRAPSGRQTLFDFDPQIRKRSRKLIGPRGSFAQPKWNSWRLTFCVLHPDDPGI